MKPSIRSIHAAALALLATAAPPALSSHVGAEALPALSSALCEPTERVLFTCPSGQKTISVCMAAAENEEPYLVFTVGEKGKKPDVLVPKNRNVPSPADFSYEQHHTNTQGGWVRLRVRSAAAGYVVYRNFNQAPMPFESAGLVLLKEPQRVLACTGPSYSSFMFAHLDEWPGLASSLVRDFGVLHLLPLSWTPCSKLNASQQAKHCPGAFAPEF